jgi:hypothetical protein
VPWRYGCFRPAKKTCCGCRGVMKRAEEVVNMMVLIPNIHVFFNCTVKYILYACRHILQWHCQLFLYCSNTLPSRHILQWYITKYFYILQSMVIMYSSNGIIKNIFFKCIVKYSYFCIFTGVLKYTCILQCYCQVFDVYSAMVLQSQVLFNNSFFNGITQSSFTASINIDRKHRTLYK